MKQKSLQRFAMMISVILAFSVIIAGCGTGEAQNNDTRNELTEGTTQNDQKNAGKNEESQKEKLKIKIMTALHTELPDMQSAFWKGLEERTNVELDIEWVPVNDYETKMELALASGQLPEVLTVLNTTSLTLIDAINKGVFWNLSDFLGDFSEYPNFKNNVPELAWKLFRYNGQIYALPRTRPLISGAELIRKDWLDQVGLPVPTTLDELYVALKKIVDSRKGTVGMLFNEFSNAFGSFEPQYNSAGGLYPKVLTDAYTANVEWHRKAYADGLMSKEFDTIKDSQYYEMFSSGIAAFYHKNPWHQYRLEQEAKKVDPRAEVELIAYLKGPKGTTATWNPGYYGGLFIPKSVPEEKVKQILKFYNEIASEEITNYITYGIEGVHHIVENGDKVMTDQGKKEINNSTIEPFILKLDEWSKTDSPLAPKEVNLRNREKVRPQYDVNGLDPHNIIKSKTWTLEWPKYKDEFESMRTKAISGKIPFEEYVNYIEELRNKKELQPAFEEFAADYKLYFAE